MQNDDFYVLLKNKGIHYLVLQSFEPMRLYLTTQDIQDLEGVCKKLALKYMRDIREEYGLKAKRRISLKAYCRYFMYDKADVLEVLEKRQAKTAGGTKN